MGRMRLGSRHGQVTAEIAVLFGAVIAALVFMAIYLQRGGQGYMKQNADQLGQQFSSTDPWSVTTTSNQSTTDDQTATVTTSTSTTAYSQNLD